MSQADTSERLRKMFAQIGAGDSNNRVRSTLESRTSGRSKGPQLDVKNTSSESAYAKVGLEALDSLQRSKSIDADKRFALEAIVMPLYRPVVDILNDEIVTQQLQDTWRDLGTEDRVEWNRQKVRSVGRINVPGIMYAGTGFVVGPNLLMTNRHVAAFFAQGLGTRVDFQTGQSASIGFYHEKGNTKTESLSVEKVVMIHPFWDMAVLQVKGLNPDRVPLVLDTADPDLLRDRNVVVIGYPGYDPSDDPEFQRVQERVFRGTYYVKRFQPGVLRGREDVESYKRIVSAVTHDCSTLGGNSGSAVIDVEKGTVVGLHFAGAYLEANYAVSPFDLASDPRVATLASAGVQFSGTVASNGDFYGLLRSAWSGADSNESHITATQDHQAAGAKVQSAKSPVRSPSTDSSVTVESNVATFSIPLQISISIGKPVMQQVGDGTDPKPSSNLSQEGQSTHILPAIDTAPFHLASLSQSTFTWKAALSLALASKLAYESSQSVKSTCLGTSKSWGFSSSEFIDIDDTQCFVALTPEIALVAFRGTESRGDWLRNINVPGRTREYGVVHRGFLGAFQAVESRLRSVLSGIGGRKLILTGHSLGGAVATVMAAEWQSFLPPAWVVTFGQPAVGSGGAFRLFFQQHYSRKFLRFVNDDDIVARVPPGYEHVGTLLHFDAQGRLQNGQSLPKTESAAVESLSNESFDSGPTMLTESEYRELQAQLGQGPIGDKDLVKESVSTVQTEGLFPSVRDHNLEKYIAKITANAG